VNYFFNFFFGQILIGSLSLGLDASPKFFGYPTTNLGTRCLLVLLLPFLLVLLLPNFSRPRVCIFRVLLMNGVFGLDGHSLVLGLITFAIGTVSFLGRGHTKCVPFHELSTIVVVLEPPSRGLERRP